MNRTFPLPRTSLVIKASLWVTVCTLSAISASWAGPNTGGALLIHTTGEVAETDYGEPCDLFDLFPVERCEDIDSNESSTQRIFWMVLAAFDPESSPRVSGVTFGVDYDDSVTFLAEIWPCGEFALSTDTWPEPGSGTAVTWQTPRTESLFPVYIAVGYHYYAIPGSFDLVPHPTQGALFADDSIPANVDEIAALGRLGFFDDPGSAPCPIISLPGACCFDAEDCELLLEDECTSRGGVFQGEDVPCEPNPCGVTPTRSTSWGEVKTTFRSAGGNE